MMETYVGHVRTPNDAIKLFEACRLGLLPRVQRRLSEKERQSIKSGSVFVWDEREAGMRRWTDGKSWSASRVAGSFLTYREMEGKRGGGTFAPPLRRVPPPGKTPDSGRGSDEDMEDGEGPDGYRYKPDGLMKQSFSITTSNNDHLHLISYYARPNANTPELQQPTTDPALRHIVPVKGMYPESPVHDSPPNPAPARVGLSSIYAPQNVGPATSPQPPYGYPLPPGYGWPPSPVATPPYQYPPPHGYPSHLPPLQHPGQYLHHPPHAHPSQYSQHPSYPPHYERGHPQLHPSSLPPPPPHKSGPPNTLPALAPMRSPRPTYENGLPEQQRSVQIEIDPQITATAAAAIQQSQAQTQAHAQAQAAAIETGKPRGEVSETIPKTSPKVTTPPTTTPESRKRSPLPVNQAQTLPSISALIHAADTPIPSLVSNRSRGNSRAGTASPPSNTQPGAYGTENGKGPQDVSHDLRQKFAKPYDSNTLRVLDRKFHV